MLFSSIKYLIFFPTVALAYFILPQKIRWLWLLIASYFFYMVWNPKYAILLASTTLVTYLAGILIDRAKKLEDEKKSKLIQKLIIATSLIFNFGILFLFNIITSLQEA